MTKITICLSATGEQSQQPVIWRLGKDFNVIVNIIKANIDSDNSWAVIELSGAVEEIQRATAWLHTTGIVAEPVERSVKA